MESFIGDYLIRCMITLSLNIFAYSAFYLILSSPLINENSKDFQLDLKNYSHD